MNYLELAESIGVSKRQELAEDFVDVLLATKNDEKMPSSLAKRVLRYWQQDLLRSESGFAALLEAAVLLEPERVLDILRELEITDVAERIKSALKPL